jgi:hypothetical protein
MQSDGRRRLRRLALSLGLAAAVGAVGLGCGRSSESSRAPGVAAQEYFPLVPGAHWRYKLALEIGSGEVEIVARGDAAIEGLAGLAFVMDEHALSAEQLGIAEVGPTAYVARDGFLCRYTGLDYREPERLRMLGGEDPARVMPLGATPGSSWTHETRLLEQPENGGGGFIKWTGRTKQVPELVVPAGAFVDVLLVETEYWDPSVNADAPLLGYQDYYARGVGLLRSVTKNLRDGGIQMAEQTLLDFDFPEERAQNP